MIGSSWNVKINTKMNHSHVILPAQCAQRLGQRDVTSGKVRYEFRLKCKGTFTDVL